MKLLVIVVLVVLTTITAVADNGVVAILPESGFAGATSRYDPDILFWVVEPDSIAIGDRVEPEYGTWEIGENIVKVVDIDGNAKPNTTIIIKWIYE